MVSVDYSNIDGPPLAVKCERKFGSALGGEVTCVCVFSQILNIDDWYLVMPPRALCQGAKETKR